MDNLLDGFTILLLPILHLRLLPNLHLHRISSLQSLFFTSALNRYAILLSVRFKPLDSSLDVKVE